MIDFQDSPILRTSVNKLLPFALMLSFYIFSYGANLPGGGFQAGVVFGTSMIVLEIGFGRRLFTDRFYKIIELVGVCILFFSLFFGYIRSGYFMGGLYGFTTESYLLSNVYYWILNLSIYLEVSASIVLIFRVFLEGREEG